MTDPADSRFFTALRQVLLGIDAPEAAPCRDAVEQAIATGAPLDLRAARLSVDALPDPLRDRILAQVHARMAADLSAIWDVMPGAPGGQKPN